MKNKDTLTCSKCGRIDKNEPGYMGTSVKMRCDDCKGEDGHATLCRKCCPSGHQTRGWPPVCDGCGKESDVFHSVGNGGYCPDCFTSLPLESMMPGHISMSRKDDPHDFS